MTQERLPNQLLSVPASDVALLDWVRPMIERQMLEEIAANDYGEEIADHLAAIERQLSNDPIEGRLGWCPLEVLQLEHWSVPKPGLPDTAYRHTKRLLACVLLLRSAGSIEDPSSIPEGWFDNAWYFLDTSASSLIRLTQSVIALGGEGPKQALGFMLWLYGAVASDGLRPFIAFCVFLLWLEVGNGGMECDAIRDLWQWVLQEETRFREECPDEVESNLWLVGTNGYEDRDGSRLLWVDAAEDVLWRQNGCEDVIVEILDQVGSIRAQWLRS